MSDCSAINGVGESYIDDEGLWTFCHCETCTRITELEAENKRLREYYEARQAVKKAGLFFATPSEINRLKRAEEALQEGGE